MTGRSILGVFVTSSMRSSWLGWWMLKQRLHVSTKSMLCLWLCPVMTPQITVRAVWLPALGRLKQHVSCFSSGFSWSQHPAVTGTWPTSRAKLVNSSSATWSRTRMKMKPLLFVGGMSAESDAENYWCSSFELQAILCISRSAISWFNRTVVFKVESGGP